MGGQSPKRARIKFSQIFHKMHIDTYSEQISYQDFPGSSDGKASAYNAGDQASIPVLGRSPREVNGNLLEYSCLENPIDRGAR